MPVTYLPTDEKRDPQARDERPKRKRKIYIKRKRERRKINK
jgi:hypothetical protein